MSEGMHGTYPKIPTMWKREQAKPPRIIVGHYATEELAELKDHGFTWFEKVDGTNVRIGWDGQKVRFGGKTDNAQMPATLLERLYELFGGDAGEQLFEQTFEGADDDHHLVTLYGEGYGAKIQKGGGNYKPDGNDFVLFDVRIGRWWLRQGDVAGIAENLGIESVPSVGQGPLWQAHELVEEGFESHWGPDVEPEGLICRAPLGMLTRSGARIMCKLKSKDLEGAVRP